MYTKITRLMAVLAIFLMPFSIMAQEKSVSGTVTSTEDGLPMPGVSIIIVGSQTGTSTDFDGNFSIDTQEGDVLQFNFIGYNDATATVGASSTVNVVMSPDAKALEEVVVTALGITREEKSLGYSVQKVGGEDLAEVKTNDVMQSLSGKIAGVQVSGSAGNMGGSTMVRIRGINSMTGNNNPLYVVDGTPISNANINTTSNDTGAGGFDYGNLASDINPDDIANVSVLKGPAATAMYGSRGANGVIMITTKSGSGKKGIGVEMNANVTFNNVYILPEYQNEYGGGYSQTFSEYNGEKVVNYGADESWGPKMDGTPVRHWTSWYPGTEDYGQLRPFSPNPDNVRDFFEQGISQTYNVAVNGNTDNTKMRLSLSHNDHKDPYPNANMEKSTISFNAEHKVTDKVKVWYSGSYVRNHAKGRPRTGYDDRNVSTSFNQWFQRQIDMDMLEKYYQSPEGMPQSWNISSPTNLTPAYWDNPYWIINKSYTEDSRNRFYGNFNVSYEPIKNLLITASARTDFYSFNVQDRIATYSLQTDMYEEIIRNGMEDNFELMINYNGNISEDLTYSVNAQGSIRTNKYSKQGGYTQGGLSVADYFNLDASIGRPGVYNYSSKKQVNSITTFGNLGYKGMLFLDASLRSEWSSALPVDNNNYLYPSVNGSFLFTELFESDFFTFGKFRAGWAQVYNDTDPYNVHNVYNVSDPVGGLPAVYVPGDLNNANIKAESVRSWETGLDMRFFNGRIGLDITYYEKLSEDLIVPVQLSGASGNTSAWLNAGKMDNKGWEVSLNATPVQTENFRWDMGINWAKNDNTVLEVYTNPESGEELTTLFLGSWGPSINAIKDERYGSFITDGFEYYQATDADGKNIDHPNNGKRIVEGEEGDAWFARESNKHLGSYLPDFTGGFTNTLTYGGFALSAHIDFQKGGKLYSVSNRYGTYSGLLAQTVGNNDKGNPIRDAVADGGGVKIEGVDTDGNEVAYYTDATDYFKHLRSRREEYIYDASFVKLREMSLSYTLPSNLFAKTSIQSMKLSLVGRNLWLIHSNAPNIDPEASLGSGNIQGFENGQIPSIRSIGFNLNVKF